jgi:acetyl-CoA carboxylase biotin carboxyl carrier protein
LTLTEKPLYLNRLSSTNGVILELKDIKALIDLMKKNDLSVFEMEKDGFKLKLQKNAGDAAGIAVATGPFSAPPPQVVVQAPAAAAVSGPAAAPAAQEKGRQLREILSPMVGTFYRASAPESPPFVDIGREITDESVVCIIEAMKVMNEIKAETKGTIAEIVAENGKPVQFGQVLFRVR